MRQKVLSRFMAADSDAALAQALRASIAQLVLGQIINGTALPSRLAAVEAAGLVGHTHTTLVDTLVALLATESIDVRVQVLHSLAVMGCARSDAVEASARFMHASLPHLRDAACRFLFKAFIVGNMAVAPDGVAHSIIEAALWVLGRDERAGRDAGSMRLAAVHLLRAVAAVQIRVAQGQAVKDDQLDIKMHVTQFLRGSVALCDAADVQRAAWTLFTDFFALDEADIPLLTEAFVSKAVPGAGPRLTYDRAFMATIVPRVIVRGERECSAVLEAMCTDRVLGHLLCEPVLRYAQLSHERPADWGRLHSILRTRQPAVAAILAAEIVSPQGCVPRPLPPELATPSARPMDASSGKDATCSKDVAAETPVLAAQASAGSGTTGGAGPAVAPGTADTIKQLEKRVAGLDRALRDQAAQLAEARTAVVASQKIARDERRALLLKEEHARELEAQVKHLTARLARAEEAAARGNSVASVRAERHDGGCRWAALTWQIQRRRERPGRAHRRRRAALCSATMIRPTASRRPCRAPLRHPPRRPRRCWQPRRPWAARAGQCRHLLLRAMRTVQATLMAPLAPLTARPTRPCVAMTARSRAPMATAVPPCPPRHKRTRATVRPSGARRGVAQPSPVPAPCAAWAFRARLRPRRQACAARCSGWRRSDASRWTQCER